MNTQELNALITQKREEGYTVREEKVIISLDENELEEYNKKFVLKSISGSETVLNDETGEVTTIYPPSKESATRITLKEIE